MHDVHKAERAEAAARRMLEDARQKMHADPARYEHALRAHAEARGTLLAARLAVFHGPN